MTRTTGGIDTSPVEAYAMTKPVCLDSEFASVPGLHFFERYRLLCITSLR